MVKPTKNLSLSSMEVSCVASESTKVPLLPPATASNELTVAPA